MRRECVGGVGVAAAVLLSACAGAGAGGGLAPGGAGNNPTAATAATPPAVGPPSVRVTNGAIARRLEQLRTLLEARGARYEGVAAGGFITHGTAVTTSFDVRAGRCVSIVALSSAGISDLDAHLFAPDGEMLAEDVEEDNHPTVQLCAVEPRRVYHVLEAYAGQGAYVIAAFATDRRGLETVAQAVGGRPGTAASASATASDAERRLTELRDGIARRGFTPSADVQRAPFAAAGALRFPVAVTPDRCYTFAAFAEGAITDADLGVYDADGEEIARDVRPERDAFVQLCPASAGTLALEVRARPGPGVVVVQAFAADAASLGGANTLWLGERTAWGASATPLAQALEATQRGLATQGYTPATRATTLTFGSGESREERYNHAGAANGACVVVAAVAGRGLGRLGTLVYDASGDLVARGAARGPASVAVVCSHARESLVVRVRAEVGSGEVGYQVFNGPPAPAWANGLERVAVSEALATQLATIQNAWRSEGTPERLRLGARAVRSREFDLPAGTCTRFAVSAGRGLPLVVLALRNPTGGTLLESANDGTATVTRCSSAAEHVRLDATTEPGGAAEFDGVLARYVRPARPAGER
jgi:hypothetical protein